LSPCPQKACQEPAIILDCLIVGGGPAGLTAALYLARYRRTVQVIDSGASRAKWIPRSHNVPGFAKGVHGQDFLDTLGHQVEAHGAVLKAGRIDAVESEGDVFGIRIGDERLSSRTVILATGVVETIPPAPGVAEAIRRGVMRVCPICDGYEAQGRTIAVLGAGDHAAREALFLRTYARTVTLLLTPEGEVSAPVAEMLSVGGVKIARVDARAIAISDDAIETVSLDDGQSLRFDLIYSAFGITPQVKLARALGVGLDAGGRVKVDDAQETSVRGVFAAGDVVRGLNQITVAAGEAAIAATAVHNRLDHNLL
jgi:thioredoxin reductase (NADPH)